MNPKNIDTAVKAFIAASLAAAGYAIKKYGPKLIEVILKRGK